jgi:hypothetical protein
VDKSRTVALMPVRIEEARTEGRRGEPVTVLLRSGNMIKVGRDLDESAFARVVALLERAGSDDPRAASRPTREQNGSRCVRL